MTRGRSFSQKMRRSVTCRRTVWKRTGKRFTPKLRRHLKTFFRFAGKSPTPTRSYKSSSRIPTNTAKPWK